MDKPDSIKREEVDGRPATVVRWPTGLVKVIFDDGEMVFLVKKQKDAEVEEEQAQE